MGDMQEALLEGVPDRAVSLVRGVVAFEEGDVVSGPAGEIGGLP